MHVQQGAYAYCNGPISRQLCLEAVHSIGLEVGMVIIILCSVLADEIPPIYAGFSKCAEHIHCVGLLWCVNFFVEIAETLKQRNMILCVAAATSLPLGAEAILFVFCTWTLIWPHVQMFCFWWVVLLIYRLFTCYFKLFWPGIPHPVPKSPSRNLYIFQPL